MTELTTWTNDDAGQALAHIQDRAIERLGDWARSADAAFEVAQKLVQSSFVPAAFKGKPVEATAAILSGLEVGLQPMAALRSFDVIQGVAAPRAVTLRAIVQSAGHHIELVESNSTRCKMRGRRASSSSWQTVTWTIDRAKQLGLTGKDNWRKQPAAMLVARATSEICRLIAADAILGIAYTAEEVRDGAAETDATPVEPEAPVRTMQRTPRPEPQPAEVVEDVEIIEDEPAEEPEPTPATQRQITAVNAGMTSMGLKERSEKLAWLTATLDREITSSKDLTKEEAAFVIDGLQS